MVLAAVIAATAGPALAARTPIENPALTYVEARAAAMRGDSARAAQLLAALVQSNGANATISRQALSEAISAGDMRLALQLARRTAAKDLTLDARLLLVADELRQNRPNLAVELLQGNGSESNLAFFAPLIRAWTFAERRELRPALETLDAIPANSPLRAYADENRAFMLLKFRQAADAEAPARRAIGNAGGRETRLRLALADAFLSAGDRARAIAMIEGMGTETGVARQRILAGRMTGEQIDTAAEAYSEMLLGLAVDLNRLNNKTLPIGVVQVARFADPRNSAATVLLGLLLDSNGRVQQALDVLATVPAGDPLVPQARDSAARILSDAKRFDEAYRLARSAADAPNAGVSDFARLGDVLQGMKRYPASADAYGRAIAIAAQQGLKTELWPLYLLRATALESAGRWPEAKQSLHAALAIAPEQPLLLNFLGYAKLERGEDLDVAEAMIRKASSLAPDDASITDSLGWALYKRGRLPDAIETLQRAAASDPHQAEIHEHLGDALYKAGRRYEARFSWNAALITADAEMAPRIRAKLETGWTTATAAP